ncbi:MAG TPA: alpha/beta fold hydrolase [Gemmatimonadales bacterium]|nr:alpha/beta fold hydrolase [Gemmatimonadales bacterium]
MTTPDRAGNSSAAAVTRGGVLLLGCLAMGATGARAQSLGPCDDPGLAQRAECGTVTVWENRAAGSGRRIGIYFAVLRAEHPGAREPLFMFAGGPGAGSTSLGDQANGPLAPVRDTRDIVLVDQRGTGRSNPLTCPTDLQAHPELAFGHVFDPALFRKCRVELEQRADLRLYTTALAAQDVDDVREALGYPRVIVVGGSYGTRLAQAYMRAYPARVALALLDGVVPFDYRAPADYAAAAQQSLDRLLADCKAAPVCASANPNAGAAFERLVARLRSGSVTATIRKGDGTSATVPFSLGDFSYAVRGMLYSTENSRFLPAMFRRADSTGNLSPFAQRYWQRAVAFSSFATGLHFSIYCAEDTRFIGDAEAGTLGAGTFTGRYLVDEYRTVCAEWAVAPLSPHARDPVTAPIPTLLFSGWFDPVTRPSMADRVAAHLPRRVQVLVRNEAHGSGFGCALPATLYVLIQGKLEGIPRVCEGITNLWGRQAP